MSIKSLLNKTCDIEVMSFNGQYEDGQHREVYSTFAAALPCRLRVRNSAEKHFSSPEYQHAAYSLYLEYLPLPKGRLRVKIGSNYYPVSGRLNMGGEERLLCLYLEEKTDAAA